MNIAAPAASRSTRAHAGWLWAALVLHALGSAALQFGSDYVEMLETRLDWGLRMFGLAVLALGLIQISALIVHRVAGAEIAASMRRRMLLATLVLSVTGTLLITSDRTNTILFGLVVGLAWRRWTRIPVFLFMAAFIAGVIAHELSWNSLGLLEWAGDAVDFPLNRVIWAANRGLSWILLAGTAFALLVSFAPAEEWESWRESGTRLANSLRIPRFVPHALLVLAMAGGLWIIYAQGSQNCRWLDRATGRSGCVGTIPFSLMVNTNLAFTQDGASLLATSTKDVAIYDFPSRRATQTWMLTDDALIYTSAIAADGSHIALAMNAVEWADTKVGIYRRGETTPFHTIVISETSSPQLWFAMDGRSLLIEDTIWDIATGAPLGPVDSDTRASYPTDSFSVRTRGAHYGIYRNRYDGSIGEFIAPLPGASSNDLLATAFSADNTLLATALWVDSSQVSIWRTSDGGPSKTIDLTPIDGYDIQTLAFTPDGRHLLVARRFRQSIEIYQLP